MKKIIYKLPGSLFTLAGLLVFLLLGNTAYGQTNTVKTNLANLALSGGSIHYERGINNATSAWEDSAVPHRVSDYPWDMHSD